MPIGGGFGGGDGCGDARPCHGTVFHDKGIGKGTGLGLPMVHGVAQQSGGQLILKSEKERGTIAEIWLPRAPDSVPARPSAPVAQANVRPLAVMDRHPFL